MSCHVLLALCVQAYFVSLMGIGPKSTEEFAERMMKLGTRVQNENHNFRLFIDAGTEHCSFAGSEAFGRTVDGNVLLVLLCCVMAHVYGCCC